jgi:hypothetical protein
MTLTREEVQRAAVGVRDWLRSPNIQVIFVRTDSNGEHVIEVRVRKKKQLHEMDESDIPIPRFVPYTVQDADGRDIVVEIRTDVVEHGELHLIALDEFVRPAPGGYQIAVTPMENQPPTVQQRGTLGVNMWWQGDFYMLTAMHVVCVPTDYNSRGQLLETQRVPISRPVYQGPWYLGVEPLARVAGAVPVRMTTTRDPTNPNRYDFAWCNIKNRDMAPEIHDIGIPKGYRAPVLGERVRWIGQATGVVQTATITSIDATLTIPWILPPRWGECFASFEHVINFDGGTAIKGDSGSAVVADSDSYVVGIVFAAQERTGATYALRIPYY